MRVLRSIGLYLHGYFGPDGKRMQADSPCFSLHPPATFIPSSPRGKFFHAIMATGPVDGNPKPRSGMPTEKSVQYRNDSSSPRTVCPMSEIDLQCTLSYYNPPNEHCQVGKSTYQKTMWPHEEILGTFNETNILKLRSFRWTKGSQPADSGTSQSVHQT